MTRDREISERQFIEKYRLQSLSREKQGELYALWEETLEKRIFLETLERLGDTDRLEYERLLEREATASDLRKFLENRIPGYRHFVREVMRVFERELQPGIL